MSNQKGGRWIERQQFDYQKKESFCHFFRSIRRRMKSRLSRVWYRFVFIFGIRMSWFYVLLILSSMFCSNLFLITFGQKSKWVKIRDKSETDHGQIKEKNNKKKELHFSRVCQKKSAGLKLKQTPSSSCRECFAKNLNVAVAESGPVDKRSQRVLVSHLKNRQTRRKATCHLVTWTHNCCLFRPQTITLELILTDFCLSIACTLITSFRRKHTTLRQNLHDCDRLSFQCKLNRLQLDKIN